MMNTIPQPALDKGFTVCTFDEPLKLGVNVFDYNGLQTTPPVIPQTEQQSDGSILLKGSGGDQYGATLCTMRKTATGFQGISFAGSVGGFFESDIAFVPTIMPPGGKLLPMPAFWTDDHYFLLGNPTKYKRDQRAEMGGMQWPKNTPNYITLAYLLDWSNGKVTVQNPPASMVEVKLPPGFDMAQRHRYAWNIWPATDTAQGGIDGYIDGQLMIPVGNPAPIRFDKFVDNTDAPVLGKNAGAVVQVSFFPMIWGTHPDCWMRVFGFRAYQKTGAFNLVA